MKKSRRFTGVGLPPLNSVLCVVLVIEVSEKYLLQQESQILMLAFRRSVCIGMRYASTLASSFESRLTIAVKKKDFMESSAVCQSMAEAGVTPTPRIYLLLLQLYLSGVKNDPEVCVECGYTTFEKAHQRSHTKNTPALWSFMMMIYAETGDHQGARELDKLRESSAIPIPEGSVYRDALKSAIRNEHANKMPPAALRDDRDFNKNNIRRQLEMERVRDG